MSQIILIPVDSISPGPWDRSEFYQQNIITAIRSDIQELGGLPGNKHLKVRKINENEYECVNGYARLVACKQEGIESVPCVVHEYSDKQALYEFIRENLQHDLTPLMIGKLGLLIDDGNVYNGRGNISPLGDLCRSTGLDRSNLTKFMIRRKIYDHVIKNGEFSKIEKEELVVKSKQLYKIRDARQDCWIPFAKYIANGGDTSRIDKSKNLIETIEGIPNHQYITDDIITFPKIVEMSLGNHTGEGALKMVVEDVVKTIDFLNEHGETEKVDELNKWLKENTIQYDGNRPFVRFRDVKTKCLSLQNIAENNKGGDVIVNEDARIFVNTIQDNSMHAVWLDFPYGVGYHSIHQYGRAIDGDTEREATELHSFVATKLYDKMVENSYVFVWFSPIIVSTISTLFEDVGFKLDSFFIWKKLNHGQLTASSVLNINEQALIFTKGRPTWLTRNNNFFECASPENKLHPCEKPFELCEYIIPSIIAPGQTLLDLSFGSGNALKAARRHGCRIMGCELNANHFAVGYNNIYGDSNRDVS